jgi:hypothetical protein
MTAETTIVTVLPKEALASVGVKASTFVYKSHLQVNNTADSIKKYFRFMKC